MGGILYGLPSAERRTWADVVIDRHQRSQYLSLAAEGDGYRPVELRITARHAAYSANLVLLAAVIGGGVYFSALLGSADADAGQEWQDQALLWHSQLGREGWQRMVSAVTVRHVTNERGGRDVHLSVDSTTGATMPDPVWLMGDAPSPDRGVVDVGLLPENMRRRLSFQSGITDTVALSALAPVLDSALGSMIGVFSAGAGDGRVSPIQALLAAWFLPTRTTNEAELRAVYLRCADLVLADLEWDRVGRATFVVQFLRGLATDNVVPGRVVADVLERLAGAPAALMPMLGGSLLKTCEMVLQSGRLDGHSRSRITELAVRLSVHLRAGDDRTAFANYLNGLRHPGE